MKEFILQNLRGLLIYLLVMNVIGFLIMGIDKFKAKKGMWRVKEQTLFMIAIFGGSIGTIAGMYIFRHKTKHNNFVYGFPVILFTQISLIIYIFVKL